MRKNRKLQELKDYLKSHGYEVPESSIVEEPKTSCEKLIELEYFYGLNTEEVVNNKDIKGISESVRNTWLKQYEIFKFFKGDLKDINTQ